MAPKRKYHCFLRDSVAQSDADAQQRSRRRQEMSETGWDDIPDCNFGHFELEYETLPPEGVRFNHLAPRDSLAETFMKLYDVNLYKKLRDFHFDHDSTSVIKFQNNSIEYEYKDILHACAVKAHIHAEQYHYVKGSGQDPFPALWESKIKPFFLSVDGVKKMPFSVGSYKKINNCWYMPTPLIQIEVSNAWSKIFVGGQVRALDEKMKRWKGKSPCTRKLQSKPETIGHWTSLLCARCHTSGLPICIGVYPFTRCATLGEKQRACDVLDWAANLHNTSFPRSLLVAGSYYLTAASRTDLQSINQRYLCSINPDCFRSLQENLAEHVKQPGQWYGKYNATTHEIIVRHRSRHSNVAVATVMSNAFKVNTSAKQPANRPPAWQEYKYALSICDDFKSTMEGHTYPLRRAKWEYAFDDLFFTSLLINTANTWKTHDFDTREALSYSYCFNQLAKELILV